jgi:hypothetical protein
MIWWKSEQRPARQRDAEGHTERYRRLLHTRQSVRHA